MWNRLRQENHNKRATAESLKVLQVIAEQCLFGLRVPSVTESGTVVASASYTYNETTHRQYRNVYGLSSRRRCNNDGCFCTMTRLQVNIVVRHIIRNDPHKRQLLREFRLMRESCRARRRAVRAERSAVQAERINIIDGANRIVARSSSTDETLEA